MESVFIELDSANDIKGYKVFSIGLLALKEEEREGLLNQVREVSKESNDLQSEAEYLIGHGDWRAQIIGLTLGIVFNLNQNVILDFVWKRIKSGSWITPQLVGYAKLLDNDFSYNAESLLSNLQSIGYPSEKASLDEMSQYSSAKKGIAWLNFALGKNDSMDEDQIGIFHTWTDNASEIINSTVR